MVESLPSIWVPVVNQISPRVCLLLWCHHGHPFFCEGKKKQTFWIPKLLFSSQSPFGKKSRLQGRLYKTFHGSFSKETLGPCVGAFNGFFRFPIWQSQEQQPKCVNCAKCYQVAPFFFFFWRKSSLIFVRENFENLYELEKRWFQFKTV